MPAAWAAVWRTLDFGTLGYPSEGPTARNTCIDIGGDIRVWRQLRRNLTEGDAPREAAAASSGDGAAAGDSRATRSADVAGLDVRLEELNLDPAVLM